MIKTIMFAYDDGIHNIRGKADEQKILPRVAPDRLKDLMVNVNNAIIVINDDYEALGNVLAKVDKYLKDEYITISIIDSNKSLEETKKQYPQYKVVESFNYEEYDLVMKICDHVFKIIDHVRKTAYIDKWINLIVNEEDFQYCRSIEANLQLFLKCNLPIMVSQIKKLRKGDTI